MDRELLRGESAPRHHIKKRIAMLTLTLILLLLVVALPAPVLCTISLTVGDSERRYESQPALFGVALHSGVTYPARLQYLEDDPYLCRGGLQDIEADGKEQSSSGRDRRRAWDGEEIVVPKDGGEPVALLAKRGKCSFEEKARTAMKYNHNIVNNNEQPPSIGNVIKHVIVFDKRSQEQPILVPMSAESNDEVNVSLLFVSHATGLELLDFIRGERTATAPAGGILIMIDSTGPWIDDHLYENSAQEWVLAALAGVFIFLASIGCFLLSFQSGYIQRDGQYIIIGPPVMAPRRREGRPPLTKEQVMLLPEMDYVGKSCRVADENTTSGQPGRENEEESCGQMTPDQKHEKTVRGKRVKTSTSTTSYEAITCGSAVDGENRRHTSPQPSYFRNSFQSSVEQGYSLNGGHSSCPICLEEYNHGEKVRLLHPCGHIYHTKCIVPWLTERSPTCPLCKEDIFVPRQEE